MSWLVFLLHKDGRYDSGGIFSMIDTETTYLSETEGCLFTEIA
jgi:hypothetical protein